MQSGRFADMDVILGDTRRRLAGGKNELSFKPTESFWESFLRPEFESKGIGTRGLEDFQERPFDARLRPHKIHHLSAYYGAPFMRSTLKVTYERCSI